MKPGIGYILIEIPKKIDSVKTASGIEFFIETDFDKMRFANVFGTVIDIPDKLETKSIRMNRDRRHHISPDKECLLQKGDTVFFHYLALKNAAKNYVDGKYWEEGGKRFALLPYAILFFGVRKVGPFELHDLSQREGDAHPFLSKNGYVPKDRKLPVYIDEFIMLNNWLLIEPVAIKQHVEKLEKYGNVIIDDERSTGKIALLSESGFKNSEGLVKACPQGLGIDVGDIIIFEKESDIPVEYDLVKTLDKPYWRMESKDIIAKRVGRDIELLQDYCLVIQDPPVKESELDVWPEQPNTGEIVQISGNVKRVKVGHKVFFKPGMYTEFPYRDGRMGILLHEGVLLADTQGQKIKIL